VDCNASITAGPCVNNSQILTKTLDLYSNFILVDRGVERYSSNTLQGFYAFSTVLYSFSTILQTFYTTSTLANSCVVY